MLEASDIWQRCWNLLEAFTEVEVKFTSIPLSSPDRKREGQTKKIELKSLILAQIERWRHALHMQVERQHGGNPGGEWRTGEECIGICPVVGDNVGKLTLIPHTTYG